MASRGQSIVITYVAWDTSSNIGKTGDVANHTLRWIKDGTASAPTNSPSEIDATNSPGVYKITLTAAECTCNSGTLAGKSSSANVSIMPQSVTFEQLPTAVPGLEDGLPIGNASGVVDSNLVSINGELTNGNNATLKLKSLDLKSNDILVPSLSVDGATGAVSEDGGLAVRIRGGSAGTGGATGADGIYVVGGGGSTTRGYALNLDAAIAGQTGLKVAGSYATAALFSGYSGADITGNIVGSISNITTLRPIKNTEYSNFMFPMFDSSTKAPKPGLSVSAERAIDGNPFSSCSNSVVEIGSGVYRITLSASDLNGDKIMFKFTSADADVQLVEIFTQG